MNVFLLTMIICGHWYLTDCLPAFRQCLHISASMHHVYTRVFRFCPEEVLIRLCPVRTVFSPSVILQTHSLYSKRSATAVNQSSWSAALHPQSHTLYRGMSAVFISEKDCVSSERMPLSQSQNTPALKTTADSADAGWVTNVWHQIFHSPANLATNPFRT